MADYNDIALLRAETAVMAALSGTIGSALQINPTSDTNIPTDSKRLLDAGGGLWRFENWNGSSWVPVTLDATTLQGNAPDDIDYSAGEGVVIDGSNVISVEQASESNLGGVQLVLTGDSTSTDKAATPALIAELLAGVGTSVEVAPTTGSELEANKRYIVDDLNSFQWWLLPEAPPDGTVITLWSNDASQGDICFVAQGSDSVRRDDADPRISNTLTSAITAASAVQLEDTAQAFETGQWDGYRVKNTTDGSIGCVDSRVSDTVLTMGVPALVGGTENDFDVSDDYTIDGGAVYISNLLNWQKVEMIYRSGVAYWTFHTSDGTSLGTVANPNSVARTYLSSVPTTVELEIARLDAFIGSSTWRYQTVDFQLRFGNSQQQFIVAGDSGSVTEIIATINHISGSFRFVQKMLNIGNVDIKIRLGAGYTNLIFVANDGTITDNAFDVIVPPGHSCSVVRLHSDNIGPYPTDDTAIVWEASSGVVKATS